MSTDLPSIGDLSHRQLFAHEFALISPMRTPSNRWQDLPVIPLRAAEFRGQPHLVPQLLPLAELGYEAKLELLDRNSAHCRETGQPMFSALLASDVSPEAMATALGKRMLVRIPGGGTAWLRFHDPRVFSSLSWWLDQAQLRFLFGPVRTWTWPEPRDGCWQQLDRPDPPMSAANRLLITPAQLGRLQRQPVVNRCLAQLGADASSAEPLRVRIERLDAHLCQARASGVVADRDLVRYVMQAERHRHSRIEEPV